MLLADTINYKEHLLYLKIDCKYNWNDHKYLKNWKILINVTSIKFEKLLMYCIPSVSKNKELIMKQV